MAAIDEKWAVGFRDRGLGHGDFGIVTASNEVVVKCSDQGLAEHLVYVHNKWLESK